MAAPDIHYFPDLEKYQARTARRLATETLSDNLPEGFPKHLDSPLVWEGKDFDIAGGNICDWIQTFNDGELQEIDIALKHFLSLETSIGFMSPEMFPLPSLHSRLRKHSYEIHNTRGFVVFRGLQVDKYSREENIIIYAGISAHIGSQRARQDRQFEGKPSDVILAHIKDLRNTPEGSSIGTPAYTNDQQAFHNDAGDIVGLLMLSEPASGGETQIASSWKIYNELAKERPDLIRTLSEDWTVDRRKPATPFIRRPVLYYQPPSNQAPERMILQCSRGSFTNFGALPRSSSIPPITEAQAEALDALHFLAEKFQFSFKLKAGDIQYLHDFSTIHARRSFTDSGEHKRHLLRMWFRDPEYAWEIPKQLVTRCDGLYGGVRAENQVFPNEPYVRSGWNAAKIRDFHNS